MASQKRKRDNFDSGQSFIEVLLSPFTAVRDWFSELIGGDDSIRTETSGFAKAMAFITLPFRLLFAFAIFMVNAWSTSRAGRAFVLGFPAVATVVACGGLLWISTFYFNRVTLGRTGGYYEMHREETSEDHPEYKLMFAEKLAELKPDNKDFKFQLGLSLADDGQMEKAASLMNMLAPIDGSGSQIVIEDEVASNSLVQSDDPTSTSEESEDGANNDDEKADDQAAVVRAHVWLSSFYQKSLKENGYDSATDDLAIDHLKKAALISPEDRTVPITLAGLYGIRANRAKKEIESSGDANQRPYLAELENMETSLAKAIKPPIVSLQQVIQIPRLIQVKREIAEYDDSRDFEETSAYFDKLFQDILKLSSKASNDVRMLVFDQVINGYITLKEFDKAVEMVSLALQTFDDTEVKRRLIRRAGLIFLRSAAENKDLDQNIQYTQRLTSVCACLNSNVREKRAYEYLVGILAHNQVQPEKLPWLQDSVLTSPKMSVNHLLIGFQMIHEGANDEKKLERGVSHWKIAYKIEPKAQIVLSNIVEVAMQPGSPRIENLDLMLEEAIEMFPDHAMLQFSQGVLFMKEGDFDRAIPIFESLVKQKSQAFRAHFKLAESYEKIGNSEKADYHKQEVEKFLSKVSLEQQEQTRNLMKTW